MFKTILFLLFVATYHVSCRSPLSSCQKEFYRSYLEIAMEMISRAEDQFPSRVIVNNCSGNQAQKAVDCADILKMGYKESGGYEIWPMSRVTEGKPLDVYCDMDTDGGGWTVIQRRGNFGNPKDYFNRDWKSYKEGFGALEGQFWLGNDNIFALTNQKLYSVRFDMEDFEQNKRHAYYKKFWIDDENNKYTLHISIYNARASTVDDAMMFNVNQKFSTKDQDNDGWPAQNCGDYYKGGWWFEACTLSNLNGNFYEGEHEHKTDGIIWKHWIGSGKSLEWTEIKIRPIDFKN